MDKFDQKYQYENLYSDSVLIDKRDQKVCDFTVVKRVDDQGVPMTETEYNIIKS